LLGDARSRSSASRDEVEMCRIRMPSTSEGADAGEVPISGVYVSGGARSAADGDAATLSRGDAMDGDTDTDAADGEVDGAGRGGRWIRSAWRWRLVSPAEGGVDEGDVPGEACRSRLRGGIYGLACSGLYRYAGKVRRK
jgi:hypothetical protein